MITRCVIHTRIFEHRSKQGYLNIESSRKIEHDTGPMSKFWNKLYEKT